MKALGRRSASTDQSALTHPTARSRGPFCPGLPLPHPCSPSAVCGPALPFSPVPAKGAPAPPSSSLLPCLWRAGPLGCWVGSWQQDQEGGGLGAAAAGRAAGTPGPGGGDSVFPPAAAAGGSSEFPTGSALHLPAESGPRAWLAPSTCPRGPGCRSPGPLVAGCGTAWVKVAPRSAWGCSVDTWNLDFSEFLELSRCEWRPSPPHSKAPLPAERRGPGCVSSCTGHQNGPVR